MTRRKPSLSPKKLSLLEQVYVQHAHPVNLVLTLIGWMWGAYFLWNQNLLLAVAFGLGFPLVGHAAVWGHGEVILAETAFGKMMLTHAHPVNTFFHVVGYVVMAIGLYTNVLPMVMWGFSVLLFGHIWGWGRLQIGK